jgi:dephospho-CoA kinase
MGETKAAPDIQQLKKREVPLIGLTGAMGAGKTTALEILAQLGARVLSTDRVVHNLYGCDRLKERLVERWGEGVLVDGVVSRDEVAKRVFADEEERRWLERTVWPLVGERVAVWYALVREERPRPKAAVVETPLLFESGMDRSCDATVAILTDPALIAARTQDRTHIARAARAQRQLSAEEKARRATFVVRNDGDLDQLRAALTEVLQQLDP